jgi:Holliday junction DNA helicase RuvA
MIAFIRGTIASYGTDWIVVDHEGMGWQMAYPHTDEVHLNEEIMVFTYMHFSENEVSLFGFASQEEKDLFMRLISVKGLGPKTAMNMLSKAGTQTVIQAIETGDVASLKKMPGIGAKSASQIVLDLKGKLVPVEIKDHKNDEKQYPDEINDAVEGLKGLGYRPSELGTAINEMMAKPGLSAKEYLQMGLRVMARGRMGK